MFTILGRNPFKKLHRAAFSGDAICPSCFGSRVKLLERIAYYTYRWQCKDCFQCFREDNTPQGHFGDDPLTREVGKNPYHSFKGLDSRIERENHKRKQEKLERMQKQTGFTPDMKIGVHKFKK